MQSHTNSPFRLLAFATWSLCAWGRHLERRGVTLKFFCCCHGCGILSRMKCYQLFFNKIFSRASGDESVSVSNIGTLCINGLRTINRKWRMQTNTVTHSSTSRGRRCLTRKVCTFTDHFCHYHISAMQWVRYDRSLSSYKFPYWRPLFVDRT